MKKTLSIILSLIMLLTTTAGLDFSSYAADKVSQYKVTCSAGVKLRSDHSTSSSQLTSIPNGATFNVTEKYMSGGYYWGKTTYGGKTGWTALLKTNHSEIYSQCCGTFYHTLSAWIGDKNANVVYAPYSAGTVYYFWGRLTDSMFPSNQKVLLSSSMPELSAISMKYEFSGPNNWTHSYTYSNACENYYGIEPNTYGTYSCKITMSGAAGNSSSVSLTINSYSISFNGNGGSCSTSSKTIAHGGSYGNLPTPTRNGYSFAGWYTSATGGAQVMSSTKCTLSSNQTLYAHWNANNYAVNFNANGGSCSSSSKTVSYDGIYGELPTPIKTGYVFDGWYTSATGGLKITNVSTFNTTGNQTLYAHWKKYDTLMLNESTNVDINTVEEIKYFYFTPSITGNYKFYSTSADDTYGYLYDADMNKITFDDDSGNDRNFSIDCHLESGETYILGAKYYSSSNTGNFEIRIELPVEISFNANSGSCSSASKTVSYDETYGELPTPTKTGYVFDGWYTSATGGTRITNSTTVNTVSSHTLYAHWSHTHSYDCEITKSATCTSNGEKTYTCTICDNSFSQTITATGHSYDNGTITKSATCTADGEKTYTCTKCNATKKETIAKTGHNYTVRTYQPTCTENGYVRHQCQNCNDAYVSDYVSPTGHNAGTPVRENIVEATVLTDGSYDEIVYCENCNVQLSRQHKTIPKNSNTISVGETKTAQISEAGKYIYYIFVPTKSEKLKFFSTSNNDTYGYLYDSDMNEITYDDDGGDGNNFCIEYNFEAGKTYVFGCRYYSSSNTGSFDVKLEKSHIHSYSETITYPTCTDRGYTTYACACGDNYVDNYVNATGHSYNSGTITKSATCTSDGEKTYTCTKCSATKKETIAKTGHNYTQKIISPTCTSQGYTEHKCSRCSDNYKDNYVNATGHSYNSGTITKSATCMADGEKTYTCTKCNTSKKETIKATGHTWRKSETVKPTCLSDGYTFYKCADCNEGYMGDYVSATGHDYDNGTVIMHQTCTADGVKRYSCKNCSRTYDVAIEAMGHDYYTNTVAPTCVCDGYKEYVCSRCGAGYIDYMIPATGHSYNSGKITKQPTCTSYGEKTYTCYSCSHTITESVYPTGHTYTGKKVASTCTKQGYTLYTCTKCNSSYTGNYTALKAHSNKTYTTKATLSKNGSVVTKCSVCNKVAKSTVVYYPKTIALSKTAYTYNGRVQKPAVSVKDSNGKVIGAGNYTVAYPNGMKNIGQYTVKITFKGNYSGSVTKTFTIIPKPIDFSSVKSPKKGKVELKWKKASGITGYQVQISSKGNFAAKSTKTLSFKQSKTSTTGKLASKKTHYFRIRTYKTVKVNGKNTKIYSAWSKAKSVKIK